MAGSGAARAPSCGVQDHGSFEDLDGLPCRNRELSCNTLAGDSDLQGDSEPDDGEDEMVERNAAASGRTPRLVKLPTVHELISTISAICEESFPESPAQVAVELHKLGKDIYTHHKDYAKTAQTCIRNKRLFFIHMSLRDIQNATAHYTFPRETFLSVEESLSLFDEIVKWNGINREELVTNVINVVDKRLPKLNTICFIGEPNAGKTLLADSIVKACVYYGSLQNLVGKSPFEFSPALHQRILLINEPCIQNLTIELFKNMLEGHRVSVDVKFESSQILERTPCVIAGNNNMVIYTREREANLAAIMARTYWYNLKPMPRLKDFKAGINPLIWRELMNEYSL